MKYIVYIKKEINTEADLPKENDNFFVCDKDGISKYLHYEAHPIFNSERFWLNTIDWYLQPIELNLPDDKEINKVFPITNQNIPITRKHELRQAGIKWLMDKIKNQLK